MAQDDIEHITCGSDLKEGNQHENGEEGGSVDSVTQVASDGCSIKNNSADKVKLRTFMFSRSAETVGYSVDPKQTGQRPDRLHARRPSTSRRGGGVEHNPSVLRYASSKSTCRHAKTNNIRTSKSCTKECEIVRADYANDYSVTCSTFYDDILRAAEESDTFTGIGEDVQGYDQEDVTLSESTALIIDNGDLEAKSDITISSQEGESCSLHCDRVVQSCTNVCDSAHERPGACRCSPKIDSSNECLDSDVSSRQQLNGYAAMGAGNKPQTCGSWAEDDHGRAQMMSSEQKKDARVSSEQRNHKLQISNDKAILQLSAESTRIVHSPVINMSHGMPSSTLPNGNIISLTDKDAEDTRRSTNQESPGSHISQLPLEGDQQNTMTSQSKRELCLVVNQQDDDLLSPSSSRLSLRPNRTTPLNQCMSEKQQETNSQHSYQGRQKAGSEKRAPYPEELATAVTKAFNSGQFHISQIVAGKKDTTDCLLQANQGSETSLTDAKVNKFTECDVKPQVQDLSDHPRGNFVSDSPLISILSFNLVKEISETAMPQRRDHNDVILGGSATRAYYSSRSGTPLSPTSELRSSREAAKKGSSGDLSRSTPLRVSSDAKVSATPSTCNVDHENTECRSNICVCTCIEEYPHIPDVYISQARSASESPHRGGILKSPNEMYYAGDSCQTMANTDPEYIQPILKRRESSALSPGTAEAEGNTTTTVSKTAARSLIKSSVPPLGSHEYLPFLNKLRQEKRARSRQQKINKSQRRMSDTARKTTASQEEDCHGDAESLSPTPMCPVGREVPADWKPGEHASHPLTKLSASYTPARKVKKRRSVRKKKRVQVRLSPRKKDKETVAPEINRHVSNFEVSVSSPPNHVETSKSCSVLNAYEHGSTDTDGNPEDDLMASFEYKRRYYERLSKLAKEDSGSDTKSEHSPAPKRVTSQVRLLKTLDELYSSASSDEGEGELPFTEPPLFDICHQTSLFNYYTRRLKHMSVLGNVHQQGESAGNNMSYIRIRKVEQEVPSALDHKRLKSLYECRMKKPALTSKIRKMEHVEQARCRYNEKSEGMTKSGKQMHSMKGYCRAACRAHTFPKITSNKAHGCDVPTDVEESDQSANKERTMSHDDTKTTFNSLSGNAPHRSYLDILKSNIHHPSLETKHAEYNSHVGNSNTPRQKSLGTQLPLTKESLRPCNDVHLQKTPPLRDRESTNRARMKVRFADPCNEYKERIPYEMSDEDTWCSTVNAMLLRANKVMDDVSRNDHRYPKPDSARVVSPVPPKSPTFLKELLKQDTIERKQAKGHTRLERRSKDPVVKQEKSGTRHSKPPTPLAMFAAPETSFLAIQPKGETAASAKNNSSLVYSIPVNDGIDEASVNEKSAGVLKISIQMSKRAQERAWLTHERIKRQRATHTEYDMKSEMKTLPKKLTPLRISKPINFQNPDSRHLERIPMRDVLSKTLMGLSTSSQQIFQPKASAPESSTTKESNFLLDQHSETLRYFRGPYMHQRSSSIVPLFSDSNNNAYLKGGEEEDTSVVENQGDNQQPGDSPDFNQDVFAVVQMNEGITSPESCEGSCPDDEETSSKRLTAQSNVYCQDRYDCDRNQQSTEANVDYHNFSETLTSITACLAGQQSQSSNHSKSCPDNNQPTNTDPSLMTTPRENTPFSLSKHATVTIQKQEHYEEATESKTGSWTAPHLAGHDAGSSTSKKVYITGMQCFENVENYRNSKKKCKINEYKRSVQNEQSEAMEEQFGTQETLLDALLGYEIERMSKVPLKTEPDSKHCQSLFTGKGQDHDTSKLAAGVGGVPGLYSTCYLNQWAPNYLENLLDTEKSPAPASPQAGHTSCQVRSDEIDSEELSIRSCSQPSPNNENSDFIHFQGISFRNEGLDAAEEAIPDFRYQVQSPRSAAKPKPQKFTDTSPIFSNFTVLGSTISLAEKRSRQVSFGVPTHTRLPSCDQAQPPSQQHLPCPAGTTPSQSSKLDGESHNSKTSVVGLTCVERQMKQGTTQQPEQAMKHMNTNRVKQPAHNVQENQRTTMAERPVPTTENCHEHSTHTRSVCADDVADIDDEDRSMNKTPCGHFNWAKVKIPPSFTKDAYALAAAQEISPRVEANKAYSSYSVYSNSSLAQDLEEEAADNLEPEEGSKCVHITYIREDMTPNVCDSIRDPPNSVCTTTNWKDMTSSVCTNTVEINNADHVALSAGATHAQNNQEDTIGGSSTQQTTEAVYENISARSRTSDVEGGGLTESQSRMAASCRSLDDISTISQISYPFDDGQDQKAPLNVSPDNALNCESDIEKDVLKEAVNASEYKEWYTLHENFKLKKAYCNKSVQTPLRDTMSRDGKKGDTLRTSSGVLDRDFLKTLRHTDLLHAVTMDRRRLLKSLQLMTRRQGYLPVFQVRCKQVTEMMPQIVVLNHCAKTFIERGSSSFSGTVRCLPVFYTADDTGFITSIYTVNWIPEGVYSFETSNMETAHSGEQETNANEQARFGKLLQYSPFASDLAFTNHQAYLIGDEVTSREEAAKTLTVAHDEAAGDVAKYFMLMCGWIPPHLNRASTLPIRDTAFESNSDKTESKERYISDNSSSKRLSDEAKCLMQEHHLPVINSVADCVYSEKSFSKVSEVKMPSLQHNVPIQLVARSDSHPVVSTSQVSKVCKLPAICKSAGIIVPEKAQPTLMLCLRCGVTVECTQAQTEDVSQHLEDILSSVERQARTTHPTQVDTKASQEMYSPRSCSGRNCQHNWEVTESGLALPLVTTQPVKELFRGKNMPLHSFSSRKRLKISLQRTTKSQTAFQRNNAFDGRRCSFPQVRSQSDIFRTRCSVGFTDTPATGISQTQESTHRNLESVGSGMPSQVTIVSARESPDNRIRVNTADKENTFLENSVKYERLVVGSKAKPSTQVNDYTPKQRLKSPSTANKLSMSPCHHRSPRHQAPHIHQTPVKHQAQLRQHTLGRQSQPLKESTLRTAPVMDKDKQREVDPLVAGWTWNSAREAVDEEQCLMETRTWSQPVIPPPFPATNKANPGLKRLSHKPNTRAFHSSKAHMAQHRRNLNQINQSYVSPYWSKKEIKRARSKTPASDSGDDRSSLSRITTISGMTSTSSESVTEEESSTEESECDSESSASGSDFFSRYANKGGPTSVDDIFKRTLPRQRLDFKLARLKEAKEKEEIEQLGYLRGREGASPPVPDHGDNAKDNDMTMNFVLTEYDMCSDADEMKELWKKCFPEVDFWDRKRRKKFKKTKILS